MKIKTLMDFLSKDAGGAASDEPEDRDGGAYSPQREKIVYIENARLETMSEQVSAKALLHAGGTRWADQLMGEILLADGKLNAGDINRIVGFQRENGLYFGEAAIKLSLLEQEDILSALARQFGYSYGGNQFMPKEMVVADQPFSNLAEEFRSIRAHLLSGWLSPTQKTLAVVSPGSKEGRSYFAANLALAFSQLGKSTLLIDANMRAPRQHLIFNITIRIGLSALLAGRINVEDLEMLPENVSTYPYLSVLSCGAVPPNPAELLEAGRFSPIMRELERYYDVIIVDSPSAEYPADVLSIASVAGSTLMVARRGFTSLEQAKSLLVVLEKARATTVGAVLNRY